MLNQPNPEVKPDWRCVGFNHTRYFNIAEEDRPYIEKIMAVYFFDKNEYTYCCELTPSYDMRFLHHTVHCDIDTPEDVRERINERYELVYDEDCYMHVSDVDKFDNIAYGEVDEDTTEDNIREYWNANHVM